MLHTIAVVAVANIQQKGTEWNEYRHIQAAELSLCGNDTQLEIKYCHLILKFLFKMRPAKIVI